MKTSPSHTGVRCFECREQRPAEKLTGFFFRNLWHHLSPEHVRRPSRREAPRGHCLTHYSVHRSYEFRNGLALSHCPHLSTYSSLPDSFPSRDHKTAVAEDHIGRSLPYSHTPLLPYLPTAEHLPGHEGSRLGRLGHHCHVPNSLARARGPDLADCLPDSPVVARYDAAADGSWGCSLSRQRDCRPGRWACIRLG